MNKQNKTLKKAMLEALEKSLGIVTPACKSVDIARGTHYKWMKEDEEYAKAVNDLDNVALDFAESQLHRQIKNGNNSSTIFYLKTKGRKRGYVERVEFEASDSRKDVPLVKVVSVKADGTRVER